MEYDIVIGLEVHAELKTESKVFCSCKNQFGAEPNTNCCPVCIGLPGALPVLNKKAVELVIKAGLTIDSQINNIAVFERKNYFYPDLSKAYQISQLVKPICVGGHLDLQNKSVKINRIHLEEDAGKLTHQSENIGTLIDYNRGGVPLMELVTEPNINSADEAVEFLTKLRERLIFADIAECKMEQGGMRCDVNISIKPKGSNILGNRTEMKNLNSFKSVHRAIEYEVKRQIEAKEQGKEIIQETRKWDDEAGISYTMRKKETSQDYRYFPDPDLLAIEISDEEVEAIRKTLPLLPEQLKEKYVNEYKLTEYDANIITKDKYLISYFEEVCAHYNNPKTVANWILTEILSKIKDEDEPIIKISPLKLAEILSLIENGKITRTIAKEIFTKVWENDSDVDKLAKELGGEINEDYLCNLIDKIITSNPKAVADYRTSDTPEKQLKWFVGQIMKETKGKANAKLAEEKILEILNKTQG